MKALLLFALLLALFCTSCATPKLATPSGRPEVVLAGTVPEVKARLASALVNRGYAIRHSDDLRVVAEKEATLGASLAMGLAVGYGDNPNAYHRAQFTLLPVAAGVRVVGELYLVTQGAFGQQNVVPSDRGKGPASLQAFLDSLR